MALLKQTSSAQIFNTGESLESRPYPRTGGAYVDIKKLADGTGVARIDYPWLKTYRYFGLTKEEVSGLEAIEYDPCNDSDYARKLLNFAQRFEK